MKRGFTNLLHHSLEQVSNFIEITSKTITKQMIKKTCSFRYISSCINWNI